MSFPSFGKLLIRPVNRFGNRNHNLNDIGKTINHIIMRTFRKSNQFLFKEWSVVVI